VIEAVVFDLDGVLVQTEEIWHDVREVYIRDRGGRYDAVSQRAMMGMSSLEWPRFMHEDLGIADEPAAINDAIVELMSARYRDALPVIDGAVDAVRRLAERFPLAVASSSNRPLIDLVLDLTGLADAFTATVSSEEVARGKPAPDVYLEAARRLGVAPERSGAVEDSHAGIRSARAAGMFVVAIPNESFPPGDEALAEADVVLTSIEDLAPAVFER
jgi:HAD superfamily hydrolase (TIGR01509 family)